MAASTPNHVLKKAINRANEAAEQRGLGVLRWGAAEAYGSHSLRRGGVTLARANGVSMLDIQQHGRWKSLTVFAYVGATESERIAVTQSFLSQEVRQLTIQQAETPHAAAAQQAVAAAKPARVRRDEKPSDAARALRAAGASGDKKRKNRAAKKRCMSPSSRSDASDCSDSERGDVPSDEELQQALFDEVIDAADESRKKSKLRYQQARAAGASGQKKRRTAGK